MGVKCEPWHYLSENVHHVWSDCAAAKRMATPGTLRSGTGGRPLCSECERMVKAAASEPKPSEKPAS
jgi:hypothetical protein